MSFIPMPTEMNETHPSRPSINATLSRNPFLISDPIGSDFFLLSTSIVVHYSFIYFFTQHVFNKHLLCTQNNHTRETCLINEPMSAWVLDNKVIFITHLLKTRSDAKCPTGTFLFHGIPM